ncbi:carnitine O-acetyltransferase-like [Ixodes scapularis]
MLLALPRNYNQVWFWTRGLSPPKVPCKGRDQLELCSVTDVLSKNVVAIHNNQLFTFCGHDAGGTPYDERGILQQLLRVVDMSRESGVPVGILTAQNRDVWAESYKRLCQSPKNAACVEAIQKAALVVCLDREVDTTGPYEESCGPMFVGGTKGENEGNRWNDKTLQFIVGREGHTGIMFVHSPMDSSLVATLLDHCYDYMKSREHFDPSGVVMDETPRRLQFELSSEMMQDIDNAKHFHSRLREDIDQVIYKFPDYGKNFIKSLGMSPDSYVQMAFQLAYYKMNKAPGLLHESVSLRNFLYGRTEGVRGSSTESLSFCKVFESPSAGMEEKEISLRKAVTKHKRDVALAISGLGMDRLLFGLKMIAMENGMPLPALFKDPAFDLSRRFRIKTTQVSARCDGVMIVGPVFPDGYFVLYNMRSDSVNFGVSSFGSCSTTSAAEFRNALKESLIQMHDCVLHSQTHLGIKVRVQDPC